MKRTRFVAGTAAAVLVAAGCAPNDSGQLASSNDAVAAWPDGAIEVESDDAPSAETESVAADAEGRVRAPAIDGRDFSEVDAIVAEFVDDRELNGAGLAIVDADGMVHEEYWGEFDAERVSFVASSSKQLTAGVMLALQEQGVLDVDETLPNIVGDAWGPDVPEITVAQMVSNTSGLVGADPDPLYEPYLCQFVGDDLEECGRIIATTPDDDADVIAPDTEYRYGGGQWQVAGAVAEFVSGKTWDELIQEVYRNPCGLDDSFGYNNQWGTLGAEGYEYPRDFDGDVSLLPPTDNPKVEGGAYLTVPDYATLLQLHLNGGSCPYGPVLSPESLEIMHADRAAAVWDGDAGSPNAGYGYGWRHHRDTNRLSDLGAYGSVPWLDLDAGYGVYLVIEEDARTGLDLKSEIEELVHDVMTADTPTA
ncbi:MAG: serine hydrolase domain-containing protein [Actinomycetota bacterium]